MTFSYLSEINKQNLVFNISWYFKQVKGTHYWIVNETEESRSRWFNETRIIFRTRDVTEEHWRHWSADTEDLLDMNRYDYDYDEYEEDVSSFTIIDHEYMNVSDEEECIDLGII